MPLNSEYASKIVFNKSRAFARTRVEDGNVEKAEWEGPGFSLTFIYGNMEALHMCNATRHDQRWQDKT